MRGVSSNCGPTVSVTNPRSTRCGCLPFDSSKTYVSDTEDQVQEWRTLWMQRVPKLFAELGLDAIADVANDPFFGRAGKLMASTQREQELKFEFCVPVYGEAHLTACASLNYHQEHFGQLFGIRAADGADAHSSCIGFGLERCAIALFSRHGMDIDAWPPTVRSRLWA